MAPGQGSQGSKTRPGHRRVAQWTRDYVRLPGIPDEYITQGGAPREVWTRFFDAFAALTQGEIERRFGSADRQLREAGVTYRPPGETADRMWSLSHLPLLIDEAEWQQLCAGIVQRAQLLELVLGDLYGEGRLVAEGAMPAAAIAGSPEYLRSVCGIKPPGGRYLNLYGADVGRGPDGRWWVLGDRTQAPSGMGYALENRLVLSRAFASLYKSMNVERVAPFFEAFRDSLRGSADRDEPRIGLLTPGAFSETYFEHATLARYLGFLLVEGDDLAVSGDRIHIRTVAGLKRLDVLLRRVDSNSLDPLELDASSQLGVPGLIDVIRKNGVVVANMPGSGVMESRALLGFLPGLCRRFFGVFPATARCSPARCQRMNASGSKRQSKIAASIMSVRNWSGSRPRRYGTMGGSRRGRSCCGCSPPLRPTAGPSCPAASAGSPSNSTPARFRWAMARARRMSGWCPTGRSPPPPCCPR